MLTGLTGIETPDPLQRSNLQTGRQGDGGQFPSDLQVATTDTSTDDQTTPPVASVAVDVAENPPTEPSSAGDPASVSAGTTQPGTTVTTVNASQAGPPTASSQDSSTTSPADRPPALAPNTAADVAASTTKPPDGDRPASSYREDSPHNEPSREQSFSKSTDEEDRMPVDSREDDPYEDAAIWSAQTVVPAPDGDLDHRPLVVKSDRDLVRVDSSGGCCLHRCPQINT